MARNRASEGRNAVPPFDTMATGSWPAFICSTSGNNRLRGSLAVIAMTLLTSTRCRTGSTCRRPGIDVLRWGP